MAYPWAIAAPRFVRVQRFRRLVYLNLNRHHRSTALFHKKPTASSSREQSDARPGLTKANRLCEYDCELWTADSEVTARFRQSSCWDSLLRTRLRPMPRRSRKMSQRQVLIRTAAAAVRWTTSSSAFRRRRCNTCEACRRVDCGVCSNCSDMPKFGGPGTKRQSCAASLSLLSQSSSAQVRSCQIEATMRMPKSILEGMLARGV